MESNQEVYFDENRLFSSIVVDGYDIDQTVFENAKKGDSDSLYQIGETYLKNFDYNKAIIWLKKSSTRDNSKAQNAIGELYYHGLGVPKDYKLAHKWFTKSSKEKNVKAFKNLALMNEHGHSVPENKGWALHFYFQAVENGDVDSMMEIGRIYCHWEAWKLALIWYERAAKKGHPLAEAKKKIYSKDIYLDYNEHALLSIERRVEKLETQNKESAQKEKLEKRIKALETLVANILSERVSDSCSE